jgi:hypothetical protein
VLSQQRPTVIALSLWERSVYSLQLWGLIVDCCRGDGRQVTRHNIVMDHIEREWTSGFSFECFTEICLFHTTIFGTECQNQI